MNTPFAHLIASLCIGATLGVPAWAGSGSVLPEGRSCYYLNDRRVERAVRLDRTGHTVQGRMVYFPHGKDGRTGRLRDGYVQPDGSVRITYDYTIEGMHQIQAQILGTTRRGLRFKTGAYRVVREQPYEERFAAPASARWDRTVLPRVKCSLPALRRALND